MTSRKRSKDGGDGGTDVYMRKGTTSGVMVADRPYGVVYDFYSVSPEYFGYTLVCGHYLCDRKCGMLSLNFFFERKMFCLVTVI
jgi:hypothetical protein